MDYELAKELKEAGWNQDHWHFCWSDHTTEPTYWCRNEFARLEHSKYEWFASPTLQELVEGCLTVSPFFQLATNPFPDHKEGEEWVATGYQEVAESRIKHHVGGSTPEKAVANLWLALNTKK